LKYSIEIGKIVEGALKYDQVKVINYTRQLVSKLEEDQELQAAQKFKNILEKKSESTLTAMGMKKVAFPVDSESRTTLVDVIYPTENTTEVILSKNNKEKLNSFILNYKNADKLNLFGIDVANTLLLYGPPGCGKTKCAYLIAREINLPLVVARLDSIISSYLGTTAKNIRILFDYIQKMPCILFLDEFDAIAKDRDDNNELGELKRVVNSLLQNIDSMSKDSLLLAATNHEQLLDSAVWRRFDYKIQIELPDRNAIIEMIDLFLNNKSVLKNKEKQEIAAILVGLSGADIEEIIKKAIRNSIIYERSFTKKDIYKEFFLLKNIIPHDMTDERSIIKEKARYLRACDKKLFSYSAIAGILDISKTMVSGLIQEEDSNG
jgi:SpoVK/Ycf46/Vps4 family AAA+-type ATPase